MHCMAAAALPQPVPADESCMHAPVSIAACRCPLNAMHGRHVASGKVVCAHCSIALCVCKQGRMHACVHAPDSSLAWGRYILHAIQLRIVQLRLHAEACLGS